MCQDNSLPEKYKANHCGDETVAAKAENHISKNMYRTFGVPVVPLV